MFYLIWSKIDMCWPRLKKTKMAPFLKLLKGRFSVLALGNCTQLVGYFDYPFLTG